MKYALAVLLLVVGFFLGLGHQTPEGYIRMSYLLLCIIEAFSFGAGSGAFALSVYALWVRHERKKLEMRKSELRDCQRHLDLARKSFGQALESAAAELVCDLRAFVLSEFQEVLNEVAAGRGIQSMTPVRGAQGVQERILGLQPRRPEPVRAPDGHGETVDGEPPG